MTAPASRAAVVAEALTWLGTPYHHHARVKGVGVDCAQLLAAVYHQVGVVPALDLGNYSPQWHMHQRREVYLQWLQHVGAQPLTPGMPPQPGDVGVWQFGRTYSHGGIVVEGGPNPTIVHAYLRGLRGVISTRSSEEPLAGVPHCYWSIL